MRVAVFNGPGRISIERVPDPQPGPQEIVLKVRRCGICGSDISMTGDSTFTYALGARMGHEYAGEVVEIGREVRNVRVGDRVTCLPTAGCGSCPACAQGRPQFCPAYKSLFGGFGDYITAPERNTIVLPAGLSLADGALVEPFACGLRALRLAGMRGGERVLILGAGTMAIAIAYWARTLGAKEVAVASRSARGRDAVMALGADSFRTFEELEVAPFDAPDIVAECIGKPGMVAKAITLVRPGGAVTSLGMCAHAEHLIPAHCAMKEVSLHFPVCYSESDFAETAKAFDAGKVKPGMIVSDIVPLDALAATIETMRSGSQSIKVHVDPSLESSHG